MGNIPIKVQLGLEHLNLPHPPLIILRIPALKSEILQATVL